MKMKRLKRASCAAGLADLLLFLLIIGIHTPSFLRPSCCHVVVQALASPWASATWKFTLSIGKQKTTNLDLLPEGWGASGGRLVLPIDVVVTSDSIPADACDTAIGSGASVLEASPTTFINNQGQQTVNIGNGGWKLIFPSGKKGRAAKLTFWLDILDDATRNDVSLSAGERIYGTANVWRDSEFERGERQMRPIYQDYKDLQKLVDETISHETGDRRLDGTDPLDTVLAYKDMTELVMRRDQAKMKLKDAEDLYPPVDKEIEEGRWPGDEEWLSIFPTGLAIRRKALLGEEFCPCGSWKAEPTGEEYEDFYSEEEKENEDRIT
jgi:hypothetical protein